MISVCIATYNGERYIKEQLLSILSQISDCDEIIISDDHSTDKTIDTVKSIGDSRIKIFYNKFSKGYVSNFENALSECNGDVIFLCDQDDIWHSDKVSSCILHLKDKDLVVHDAKVVDTNLYLIHKSYFEFRGVNQGFINNFIKIGYLGCCMAFRKELLKSALPFPKNRQYVTHDSWITLLGEFKFRVGLIPDKLISYRRHSDNTSNGGSSEGNSIIKKIKIRVYTLCELLKRT